MTAMVDSTPIELSSTKQRKMIARKVAKARWNAKD
jgi:hypothetical protein